MKKNEIKVGAFYVAKVNGKLTTVRVDKIFDTVQVGSRGAYGTGYEVTNLATGRKTTFRSAQKFRSEVNKHLERQDKKIAKVLGESMSEHGYCVGDEPDCCEGEPGETCPGCGKLVPETEAEQRPDPTQATRQIADASSATSLGTAMTDKEDGSTPLAQTLRRCVEANNSKLRPTDEQQDILAAVKGRRDGVLVVEAGAGTGKTSTLKMIEEAMPGNGQYTAFNAALVAESKTKFRKAACNTTHSLAFRAVGNKYAHRLGGGRVKSDLVASMLGISPITLQIVLRDPATGEERQAERVLQAPWLAGQVMGAVRRFCQSADPEIAADHFRYIDGIDLPSKDGDRTYDNNGKVREALLPAAKKAWKDLSSTEGQLPFAHDHYVKIWQLDKPVISADYILLDESQDTAPVFLDVIRQQRCLVILVGDSAQSIYEWRGAVNAMASFPDAPRQMLSQSFRFGQAIADVANSVLDSLEQPTELRLKGLPSIDSKVGELENPKAVLCRTNALAVSTVLNGIASGLRPHLIGGGSEVVAFVRAAKELQEGRGTAHPELACFSTWGEVEDYSKLDEGEDLKLLVKLIKEFGCDQIIGALGNMPKEEQADLVVCTAHKSKGREWESVKLASDFPTNGKSDDAARKLVYVAATRAKFLLDVSSCPFFTGEDALEIIRSQAPQEGRGEALPPAPSTPPAPKDFTWAKGKNGDWLVRGPKGATGEVQVVRKNGSKATKRLASVVWENGEVALYRVS